ncbi:ABC transporter ATP-binding protein [Synechococcus sp. PCC 6312]|uniref:ABC transporter ATP-binding protein n=1 Tax=Synechococcus sp. (strain ATCC 27167 / PCC 6312) TaxID=195253 RepID=UPI00029F3E4D|nr:ABC transporter ATP-binding protein [Synechococcus sp. PCC 6312]AFY61290.1 ABC-type spermidine/putrescine transport system, ATPase component [Synechococcus sp. PCC 6312]
MLTSDLQAPSHPSSPSTRQPILRLAAVTKRYQPQARPAVESISLELQSGHILSLLGPSGCGKTTLLRLIAGFETIDQGEIYLNQHRIATAKGGLPPEQRSLGMVFQDFALFPHLTVFENIAFGLQQQRLKSGIIRAKVASSLALVGLEGMAQRYPHQLSGGQQQRVALARALAPEPTLILLDEPLSNLDALVRIQLREELRQILKVAGTTAIFVTHDQEEALGISDVVAVMQQGKLEQWGTPEDIYLQPASRFVAGFVTQANFLPAQAEGSSCQTEVGQFTTPEEAGHGPGELMLREEELILEPVAQSDIVIRTRQFLGREYRYCLQTASGRELHARSVTPHPLPVGTHVIVKTQPQAGRFFPSPS